MEICFTTDSEQVMYRSRDQLGPQLRRLRVKYKTYRGYPSEAYQFYTPIVLDAHYTMTFDVQVSADDPRVPQIRGAAQGVAETLSGVISLEIEM